MAVVIPEALMQGMLKGFKLEQIIHVTGEVTRIVATGKDVPTRELILKQFPLGPKSDKALYEDNKRKATVEFNNMKALAGKNEIVKAYKIQEYESGAQGFMAILMEDAGPDLEYYMLNDGKKAPFQEKISIAIQIARALNEMQRNNVMHCDLKPTNIAYKNGFIKIIDFGTTTISSATSYMATQKDTVKGFTLCYAPPEIVCKTAFQPGQMDIFSYGMVINQLFYDISQEEMRKNFTLYCPQIGEKAYKCDANYYEKKFWPQIGAKPIPNDPSDGTYSTWAKELLSQCLVRDYHKRPTFADVLEELKKFVFPVPSQYKPPVPGLAPTNPYQQLTVINYFNPINKTLFTVQTSLAGAKDEGEERSKVTTKQVTNYTLSEDAATITTPENRIFVIGGTAKDGTAGKTIVEINTGTGSAVVLPTTLTKGRILPTLVAEPKRVYVLGGKESADGRLKACEEFAFEEKKIFPMPELNEAKCDMAACKFNTALYVFGGEVDFYVRAQPHLLHNYTPTVEMLDLRTKKKWDIVVIEGLAQSQWDGCGLSAAIPWGTSIMIVGGFIRNKSTSQYQWAVNHITFTPSSRTFSNIDNALDGVVDYYINNGYPLKGNVGLICSRFPKTTGNQTFFSYTDKDKWVYHLHRKQVS